MCIISARKFNDVCLGRDEDGREYRFFDSRIYVIDSESKQTYAYYSTRDQTRGLIELKRTKQPELSREIEKNWREIESVMGTTESLTKNAQGKKKSYFDNPTKEAGKEGLFKLGDIYKNTHFATHTLTMYPSKCKRPRFEMEALKLNNHRLPHNYMLVTLRKALNEFDGKVHPAFMHPNWIELKWRQAVNESKTASAFVIVLSQFATCIKEVAFNSDWHKEKTQINRVANETNMNLMWRSGTRRSQSVETTNYINISETGRIERERALTETMAKRGQPILDGRKTTSTEKQLIAISHREFIDREVNIIVSAFKNSDQNEYKCRFRDRAKCVPKCGYCCVQIFFKNCEGQTIKTTVLERVRKEMPQLKFPSRKGDRRSAGMDNGCKKMRSHSKAPLKYPPTHTFLTKKGIRSMNVLPKHELRQLARRGGLANVDGFVEKSTAQQPMESTCWHYATMNARTLLDVAWQICELWKHMRWEDMRAKPAELPDTDIIEMRKDGRFSEKIKYSGNDCHEKREEN